MSSGNFSFSFQKQFNQISAQHERENEEKDDEYDFQGKEKNPGYGKLLCAADEKFNDQKENDQKNDYGPEYPGPFFSRHFHFIGSIEGKDLQFPFPFR